MATANEARTNSLAARQFTFGNLGWYRRRAGGTATQPPVDRSTMFVQVLFSLYLLVVMVRISTGAADNDATRAMRAVATEQGDAAKQILYILYLGVFTVTWVRIRGIALPRSLSIAQYAVLGWILLSNAWAMDHLLALRRSLLITIVILSLGMGVDMLGPRRSLAALYWGLAICVVASLVAIPLFAWAKHPLTETDPTIAGGWRGIFVHKNTAAAVCAVSFLIYFNELLERRRWSDLILCAVCLTFMIGSKSKTPLGLMPIAVSLGVGYRYMYRDPRLRLWFIFFLTFFLFSLWFGWEFFQDRILRIIDDPESFTGRAGIWRAVLAFSADHFWLGSGYSSLWATTVSPPILPYTNAPYQEFIVHSHNGYLEMLGTTGFPGLVLAIVAAIVIPLYDILTDTRRASNHINATAFAVVIYCALENMFETQLYSRDREIWVCFLIMIMCLRLNVRAVKGGTIKKKRRYMRVSGPVGKLA